MAETLPPPASPAEPGSRLQNIGGTPGGLGEFLLGFCMLCGGGYLFLNQVHVTSGFWHFLGPSSVGMLFIPIFIGLVMLFLSGKSVVGWLLTLGGVAAILVGVVAELQVHFRSTSLFNTLGMIVLMAGGLGLVLRGVRPHPAKT